MQLGSITFEWKYIHNIRLHIPEVFPFLQGNLLTGYGLSNTTNYLTMLPYEVNVVELHDDQTEAFQLHPKV